MIDLKKLQDRFDTLFEQETVESFNQWFEEKKKKEVIAILGVGEIELMKTKSPAFPKNLLIMPIKVFSRNSVNSVVGNTQYSMAA